MTATIIDIDTISRIETRGEAEQLALGVYRALVEDLEALTPHEWEAPTVCDPWTVADMVRHLLGAAKANLSLRELARQQISGARRRAKFDGNALDAVNDLQVREHRDLAHGALISELNEVFPRSVRIRTARRLFDRIEIPLDMSGSTARGMPERLNLGELFRVIYTRDVWLHRIDIARAVGREPRLGMDIDRRIVEDVVKEWADRHGRPFDLRLTGPAGGHYRRPGDGPVFELDGIEFCWILSGRAEPASNTRSGELLTRRVFF